MASRRLNIRAIIRDPAERRELLVRCIFAIQSVEDSTMTMERAGAAYAVRRGGREEVMAKVKTMGRKTVSGLAVAGMLALATASASAITHQEQLNKAVGTCVAEVNAHAAPNGTMEAYAEKILPGAWNANVRTLGSPLARFRFGRCMAELGYPQPEVKE